MGLIEDFVKYHGMCCDAPDFFARLESIFLIGASMGHNFRNPLNVETRHNFFIFIVAATSRFRKSTSIDVMRFFLKTIGLKELSFEMTPESLISGMAANPLSMYVKDEFGNELSKMYRKGSYMSGFVDIVSQMWNIYDSYTRTTQTGGDVIVENPYLCCFLATTDERFDTYARNDLVMSGFLPRFLMYFPDENDIRPFKGLYYEDQSPDTAEKRALRSSIIEFLRVIKSTNRNVEFRFADMNYFNVVLRHLQESDDDPTLAALKNKLGLYLIKLADVLKISDMPSAMIASSNQIVVGNEYIDKAVAILRQIIDKYPAIFENRVEWKNFNLAIRRIIEYIRKNQKKFDTLPLIPITHEDLLKASLSDFNTFVEVLTTLEESGKVLHLTANYRIDPDTQQRIEIGKDVYIMADFFDEFRRYINCDPVGISLRNINIARMIRNQNDRGGQALEMDDDDFL